MFVRAFCYILLIIVIIIWIGVSTKKCAPIVTTVVTLLILAILFFPISLFLYLNTKGESVYRMLYPEVFDTDEYDNCMIPFSSEVKRRCFFKRANAGYEISATKNVAVLGLAYNFSKKQLCLLERRLKKMVSPFKDHIIIIYCADSTNDTAEIVASFDSELNITIPPHSVHSSKLCRIEKMTKLRNACLDSLDDSGFEYDYVLLYDMDMQGPLSHDGLVESIERIDSDLADVVFSNGLNNNITTFDIQNRWFGWYYYDLFALRTMDICYYQWLAPFIYKAPDFINGDHLACVKSAFGGFGIYSKKAIDGIRYVYEGERICEHVNYNKQIYEKGYRLAVNPSFINISGPQGVELNKCSS